MSNEYLEYLRQNPEYAGRINSKTTREELLKLLVEQQRKAEAENTPPEKLVMLSAQVPESINDRINALVDERKKHAKTSKRSIIIEALTEYLDRQNA